MHPNDLRTLVKECLMETLKERLIGEEINPVTQEYQEAIYPKLQELGFQVKGNAPREYMEYYKYNFATVQCNVDYEKNTVRFEKYYDSERLADNNFSRELQLPAKTFSQHLVDGIIQYCLKLKTSVDKDDPIFGGTDDMEEGFDPQSQGPNPNGQEDPYPAWNNKMRQMEENSEFKNIPLKKGWYEYRVLGIAPEVPEGHVFRSQIPDLENHPELWQEECPYTINNKKLPYVKVVKANVEEGAFEKLMGYVPHGTYGINCSKCKKRGQLDIGKYGNLLAAMGAEGWKEKWEGGYSQHLCPDCSKGINESTDRGQMTPRTFQEIRNQYDPDGTKHDLTLKCIKCGTTQTCRCSKPKRKMEGICDECAKPKTVTEVRSGNVEVEWQCPSCRGITDIFVEVESPSDYYPDKTCEHCGEEIHDAALDRKIMDAVSDYFASRAEFQRDIQQDR